LRKGNVLSFCGTERYFGLKSTDPENWAIGIHDDIASMQENIFNIVSISLRPTTSKVNIDISLKTLFDIGFVHNTVLARVE
jgi:hypothetical protein